MTAFSVDVGTYSASFASAIPGPEIRVDNSGAPNSDVYVVVSRASDGLVGGDVNGFELTFAAFVLIDSTNTVFSDALILPLNISLSDFDSNFFVLVFGGGSHFAVGELDSLERVSAVPEPSTWILALTGLVAASGVRCLRRRNNRG